MLLFFLSAAPQLGFDDFSGVWRIDDAENSFSTQPFRIKYARQDVHLSVMIAFNLYVSKYEVVDFFILTRILLFKPYF